MKSFAVFISLSLLFISCSSNKKEDSKKGNAQMPVNVEVIIAGLDTVNDEIIVNGSVLANENIELHPEISGRLTFLNIPDGGRVKKGDVLARINDAELQAQFLKSNVQLSLAEKNESRVKKLLSINGVNQSDYDVALNNLNSIKADIQLISAQIDKSIIRAPFDGVLGLRMISLGAYVTPQTLIATLYQLDEIKIDFTTPDNYIQYIKKGSVVKITSQGNVYPATVSAVDPEINNDTRNIKVRAVLIKNEDCKPGSFVSVSLDAGSNKKRILVPTNAIMPDATSKKIALVKDGKGKIVKVKTGIRTADFVEIVDGLTIGDTVIIKGVLFVKPDALIKVSAVKSIRG